MCIFKKKGNKIIYWMFVVGNIFSGEVRILDCLFCKCQGGGGDVWVGIIFFMLGGLEFVK